MRNPCASRQGFGFRSAVDLSVWFASGLVQLASSRCESNIWLVNWSARCKARIRV